MAWSDEDIDAAGLEGWGIYDAAGSEHNKEGLAPLQVQRDDDGPLGSDDEAWLLIVEKSNAGSAMHRRALRHVREESPGEFQAIVDYALEQGREIIMEEIA